MLQVMVPSGVAEGGQFQANTPSGPMLVTVPPGVKSGDVIELSAPAAMAMERSAIAEASTAMVGTYHNDSSVCCGLGGGTTDLVVTESNQVLTLAVHGRNFCCCFCGTTEGTGSRGVNDATMVFTTNSVNKGVLTPASNTQTITSATRDTIEMDWVSQVHGQGMRIDMHLYVLGFSRLSTPSHAFSRASLTAAFATLVGRYGKMIWDLAAGTIKQTCTNHPLAPTTIYKKV